MHMIPEVGGEVDIVSAWWTPEHLDVTHVPMTYARPKAPWIDEFKRLRRIIRTDDADRMFRRRSHAALVEAGEF